MSALIILLLSDSKKSGKLGFVQSKIDFCILNLKIAQLFVQAH